jgi:hypothetical protein
MLLISSTVTWRFLCTADFNRSQKAFFSLLVSSEIYRGSSLYHLTRMGSDTNIGPCERFHQYSEGIVGAPHFPSYSTVPSLASESFSFWATCQSRKKKINDMKDDEDPVVRS